MVDKKGPAVIQEQEEVEQSKGPVSLRVLDSHDFPIPEIDFFESVPIPQEK